MEWLELKIDTSPSGLDAVTELLEQQGITGVIIDDEADFKDFLEHNKQYWDYVDEELLREKAGVSRVTFYLERNEAALHTIAQVRIAMSELKKAHPDYAPLRLTIDNVADADWENNWKKFYKPMEIGERLLVVPQWEQVKRDHGRVKLVLNPGLTFGTGSHATTRLCLQALDKCIHGGEKILDLGCGSGILSIAALVLGASARNTAGLDLPTVSNILAQHLSVFVVDVFRMILAELAILSTRLLGVVRHVNLFRMIRTECRRRKRKHLQPVRPLELPPSVPEP